MLVVLSQSQHDSIGKLVSTPLKVLLVPAGGEPITIEQCGSLFPLSSFQSEKAVFRKFLQYTSCSRPMFSSQESNVFDAFVDPMMITPTNPEDDYSSYFASDEPMNDDMMIPELPSQIPSTTNLYEKIHTQASASPTLSTTALPPSSPMMFPYSPHLMGSPSALMMGNEPAWMHSTRTRRRRSAHASPAMGYVPLMGSPAMTYAPGMYTTSPPMQMAHLNGMYYAAAPTASPAMNVTVKLPMAPLTPTNTAVKPSGSSNQKVPLMLPCHLLSAGITGNCPSNEAASNLSSGVPSRASSVAPGSSISNYSASSSSWFTQMSATKDQFLEEAAALKDFANVTVMEMKQLLRKFGLNSTGKKVQLMERIKEIETFLRSESRKHQQQKPRTEVAL